MQTDVNSITKQLDSYSMLIVSKYFSQPQDYINLICVNSKFKDTTEKLRYNPIPVSSFKLFPKMQTQYLYYDEEKRLNGVEHYAIKYVVDCDEYSVFKKEGIKCFHVSYTVEDRIQEGVTIPTYVNMLGNECFQLCEMKSITIPNNITSIGNDCFYYCSKLEDVTLSKRIVESKSVVIPSSIQLLGTSCFDSCLNLRTITIPNSVTEIGFGCFKNCTSLQSVDLPSSLVALETETFSMCSSLSKITFPSTLTSIGYFCFTDCIHLTTITLPISLRKIGNKCFFGCKDLITIDGVKECNLGKNCFGGCGKFTNQTNPKIKR
ncbi:Leucine rich repeat containing protein BspA family protein [Entamoeba marina]